MTPLELPTMLPDGSVVVRPDRARVLLGDITQRSLYELLNAGELESYIDGKKRLITVRSIMRYISRKFVATGGTTLADIPRGHAGPGRRRKTPAPSSSTSPTT